MQRLYINGRFLTQAITGVQRSAQEIVRALDRVLAEDADGRSNPALRITLLTPRLAERRQLPQLERIQVQPVGRLSAQAWEQLELPWYSRKGFLLSLANLGPLWRVQQCVTIHDASVFAVPEAYTAAFRRWYRRAIPGLGRRARRILTDSEFSRQELARWAGIAADKIQVVPLAPDHILRVPADERILDRHDLRGRTYILAVSSLSPHKNLAAVLAALPQVRTGSFELVVVGGANPKIFRDPLTPLATGVRQVGYVNDAELRALYQNAAGLVFPSLYEGFGLPPLEAMACGCPVIVSRAASLPEVCGEAALYCDPADPGDIAARITELLENPELQADLRQQGLRQAARYSWDSTARRVLQTIRPLLCGVPN